MIFGSFPKIFTPDVFKSKYRNEVIKTLNIEAPTLKVLWENCFRKICKNSRKNIHYRVRFQQSCKSKIWSCNKHGTFSESFLENLKKFF